MADELLAEVRSTDAFATLYAPPWQRVLDFIVRGGDALEHYPEYRRVVRDADGAYRVHDRPDPERITGPRETPAWERGRNRSRPASEQPRRSAPGHSGLRRMRRARGEPLPRSGPLEAC